MATNHCQSVGIQIRKSSTYSCVDAVDVRAPSYVKSFTSNSNFYSYKFLRVLRVLHPFNVARAAGSHLCAGKCEYNFHEHSSLSLSQFKTSSMDSALLHHSPSVCQRCVRRAAVDKCNEGKVSLLFAKLIAQNKKG